MQIKKLEETLGKRLFLREKRTISITSDGQRLMPFARDIVEKAAQAAAAFDESALRGSVRLGTADDYAERFLPTILAGFSRQNPLVEVTVECMNTAALEPLVRRGELDMALVTHNEVRGHSELIRTEPLHWVTSSRHIVHTSRPVPLALGSPHCVWRRDAVAALDKGRCRTPAALFQLFGHGGRRSGSGRTGGGRAAGFRTTTRYAYPEPAATAFRPCPIARSGCCAERGTIRM